MKRIITLLILFAFSASAFAQTKREWIAYGDIAFKNGDYYSAAAYYLKVVDNTTPYDIIHPYETKVYTAPQKKVKDTLATGKDSVKGQVILSPLEHYILHQIAECYRLNRDYKNAEIWFERSLQSNPPQYPYESYWYGDALMKNKKYPAANLQFEKTANAAEKKDTAMYKLAKNKIAGCYLAIDPNSMQKGVVVTELDSIFNTGTSSFALNYYGDENNIVFSSARDGNTVTDPKKQIAKYTSDIFTLSKPENTWVDLKKVEGPINTEQNEGSGFLTFDRERFFFTRALAANKNTCDIHFSRLFNGEWLMAQKMNEKVNLEGYKSTDPCVTFDGSIIYFSSNRPGGYGKMDIWYEFIDQDGRTYGDPVNLGPVFNTAEDEVSPYFHRATNTLYFSSAGHAGFGGLDVFKSSLNLNDSTWSLPRNLGQPINSNNDDAYFVLNGSQLNGFVSSDRKECKNCPGGACYKIYSVTKQPLVYDVRGTVYNSENNVGIPNATITFKDIRSDWEPFVIHTDSTGGYSYTLKPGVELYMKAQKTSFLGDAGTVFTLGLTESRHFEKDFFLAPITSEAIAFPNVEFDNEMVVLSPPSKKILDDLADFLKLNNNLNVEITSHTDIAERGVDKNNIKLSEERSKSCADYLISKGIPAQRLISKGLGDTKLLIAKPKTEDEHQKNRRTTFKLVK